MWEEKNHTFATDFILLGLFHRNQYGLVFISLILINFTMAILGNTVLIVLIRLDIRLHTPMYFLLSHLSFVDILHISNIVPKMASNFISGRKSITLAGCALQIFLYVVFVGAECLLLTGMSYDRYVAICHPLRYPILMNYRISVLMAAGCWLLGTFNSIFHTGYVMHLPFCGSRAIDHFFCEVPALLKISCVDTSVYEKALNVCASIFFLLPFCIIIASYSQILRTVFHIKSAEAQKKALSTCFSHMTVVAMYYVSCIFTYMRPMSYHTPRQDKLFAILYTILTPMLNPVIYSLRNKDVICALKKVLEKAFMHGK